MKHEIINKFEIVCISTMDWDDLWTRKQQFMKDLANLGCKVLYVEQLMHFLSLFKNPRLFWKKFKLSFKSLEKEDKNLYIYHPPIILPFYNHYQVINRINIAFLSSLLRKKIKELGFNRPILWIYPPHAGEFVGNFNEEFVIYDCVDEYSAYPGLLKKGVVQEMERNLLEKANIVFVTAEGLYERKKKYNPHTFFIPNACDVEHFLKATQKELPVPGDVQFLSHPVIGYVGSIHSWFDSDLVAYVAQEFNKSSILIIGPEGNDINIDDLKKISNIIFLGKKSYQELPLYLKVIDICIIPFKISEIIQTVNPLKFYEYLAAGKPVVSTDLPELEEFKDIIKIAHNKEEFVRGISEVLGEENQALQAERLKRVKKYSYRETLSEVIEILNSHLLSQKNM